MTSAALTDKDCKPETSDAARADIVKIPGITYPDREYTGQQDPGSPQIACNCLRTAPRPRDQAMLFWQRRVTEQGINMLNYERHLLVVTVICLVIIAIAVAAVVLEVPLPFISKD